MPNKTPNTSSPNGRLAYAPTFRSDATRPIFSFGQIVCIIDEMIMLSITAAPWQRKDTAISPMNGASEKASFETNIGEEKAADRIVQAVKRLHEPTTSLPNFTRLPKSSAIGGAIKAETETMVFARP